MIGRTHINMTFKKSLRYVLGLKSINWTVTLAVILIGMHTLYSCKREIESNQLNIYVTEDNPGWHFIDLRSDSGLKRSHVINVKFAKGQKFKTVYLRTAVKNYHTTYLYENGDTVKSGLWFSGEYHYDSLDRTFLTYYMPTQIQRRTIRNYIKDSIYDDLRYQMDTVVENYLRKERK
jgi:hypothetical protein